MDRYIAFGITKLARGIRRGDAPLAVLGALALGLGLFRRYSGPPSEPIYTTRLKPGHELKLRAYRGATQR